MRVESVLARTCSHALDGNEKAKTASGSNGMTKNPHIGSSLDDLFEEEGTLDEINIIAIKRLIAWQIQQEMVKQNLSKIRRVC